MPCSLTVALMKAYSPLRLRKVVILVLCLLAAVGHIILTLQVDVIWMPHRAQWFRTQFGLILSKKKFNLIKSLRFFF